DSRSIREAVFRDLFHPVRSCSAGQRISLCGFFAAPQCLQKAPIIFEDSDNTRVPRTWGMLRHTQCSLVRDRSSSTLFEPFSSAKISANCFDTSDVNSSRPSTLLSTSESH